MFITEHTKISTLLKHHPDALDAIVSLSPDFKKLRNPVLRALMAKRTSIAMASKVGGCKPEDFFRILAPLGFETETEPKNKNSEGKKSESTEEPHSEPAKPEYLQNLAPENLINFDVRALLAGGDDPLKAIQQKIKSLQSGQALIIINNFEPVPLIKLLEKQGYESYVQFIDPERIETYFYRINGQDSSAAEENKSQVPESTIETPATSKKSQEDWNALLNQYKDKIVEIDVRHLEMPMPMMTILENLETLPAEKALYVKHKKVPVFLLTELKDRDFDYRIKEVQEGEVYLLIFKDHRS